MNSYKPCREHENGHYENCKDCEIDTLRDLLRRVANADIDSLIEPSDYTVLWIPRDLWESIAPLRNGGTK